MYEPYFSFGPGDISNIVGSTFHSTSQFFAIPQYGELGLVVMLKGQSGTDDGFASSSDIVPVEVQKYREEINHSSHARMMGLYLLCGFRFATCVKSQSSSKLRGRTANC